MTRSNFERMISADIDESLDINLTWGNLHGKSWQLDEKYSVKCLSVRVSAVQTYV